MIDFTNCDRDHDRVYGGANGPKICIIYNDKRHMLKFPANIKDAKRETHYSNSIISEFLSCKIIESVGLKVQSTVLGTYLLNGSHHVVVACRDFTEGGFKLSEFALVKNGCLNSVNNGAGTELDSVLSAIEEQTWMDSDILRSFFWDMFIMDALLGNFDRHNGNWGFLTNSSTGGKTIAPIFDCGSCLYPQLSLSEYQNVLNDQQNIDTRVYDWPQSALRQNGRKINYFDYISSLENPDCNAALERIHPRVDLDKIHDIIFGCEALEDIQKEFYFTMIAERKEKILNYSIEKLHGRL